MTADTLARHRFSIADFHRMAELGILPSDRRLELIEGDCVTVAPMGSWHMVRLTALQEQLVLALSGRAVVSSQIPIRLGNYSEPEPDIVVLRYPLSRYETTPPGAADVHWLVEIADTTARSDREVKVPLYARHGIPEMWLLDRQAGSLTVHREPRGESYGQVTTVYGGSISPLAFADVGVEVGTLL